MFKKSKEVVFVLIQRPDYLHFLMEWKDQPIIKVISGIRRCGNLRCLISFRISYEPKGSGRSRSFV